MPNADLTAEYERLVDIVEVMTEAVVGTPEEQEACQYTMLVRQIRTLQAMDSLREAQVLGCDLRTQGEDRILAGVVSDTNRVGLVISMDQLDRLHTALFEHERGDPPDEDDFRQTLHGFYVRMLRKDHC